MRTYRKYWVWTMTPQEIINQYEKALASQNWSNIEPLIHEDICVTFSSGTYKGKPEVQKIFEHNFSLIKDEQYKISDLHWIHVGKEFATCLYHFHWSGFINGEACSGGGRGTSVLINTDKGWQLLTEHLGPFAN